MAIHIESIFNREVSVRLAVALTAVGVLGAVAVAVLLHLGLLPRGTLDWSWQFRGAALALSALPLVVAALVALLLSLLVLDPLRKPGEPSRRHCVLLLVLLVVLGMVLLAAVAMTDPAYPLQAPLVVMSDLATGYYGVAVDVDGPGEALRGAAQRCLDTSQPDRVRTHPPGPVLLMWVARQVALSNMRCLRSLEDWLRARLGVDGQELATLAQPGTSRRYNSWDALAAVPVAWLLTLLPAFLVLPAYGLGAALVDRRVGLIAALLSLSVPALLVFVPGIDGPGAVIALTALYCWAGGMRTGAWWLYALAGISTAAALLWSVGYLALAPVMGFMVFSRDTRGRWPHSLGQGLIFAGAGFAMVHGLLDALYGYRLWEAFPLAMAAQRQIMIREGRDYFEWLSFNPYAFALFTGPALLVLFLAASQRPAVWHGPVGAITAGAILTLALLVLLGSTRGEVERIWLFLMPLLGLPAAVLLDGFPPRLRLWLPALLVLSQVGYAVFLHAEFALVTPF